MSEQADLIIANLDRVKVGLVDPERITFVAKRVAAYMESQVPGYPAAPGGRPLDPVYSLNGKPSIFKTKRQRGWFFANLRSGGLNIPYMRTGMLGRSIASQITADASGATITVGVFPGSASYAKYVIGSQQYYYHARTGWFQLKPALQAASPGVPAIIAQALSEWENSS